jgi:dihydroorotate dehydrogenase (NAD+) catalytic subunit
VVEVAGAVHDAGAEAVTLVNTLLGMVLDPQTGRPALAAGGGGYSGAPLHAVAVRTVHDVRAALPDLAIVGVGGVSTAWHAAELMLAGANAVQVGTATFNDPKAPLLVQTALTRWCSSRGLTPTQLSGLAHRGGLPPSG